jgi:DNA-binding transcriptional MocR family regulator
LDNKEERRASALPVSKVRPAYQQIADQIRGLIIAGTLNPGEQLPSDEQLSGEFGVSRNTTREALRMLSSQDSSRRYGVCWAAPSSLDPMPRCCRTISRRGWA